MNFEESKRRRDAASDTRCREFTLPNARNSLGRAVHGVIWDGPNCLAGNPMIVFGHGASGDRHQSPIPYLAKKAVRELGYFAVSIDGPVTVKEQWVTVLEVRSVKNGKDQAVSTICYRIGR